MANDFLYILVFLFLGIAFVGGAFAFSWLIRSQIPANPLKNAPYECGEDIKGTSRIQFNVRYYLFALIFVVFDVEILFVAPWALVFREMGRVAYFEMLIFVLILGIGLAYAWRKGALEWQ